MDKLVQSELAIVVPYQTLEEIPISEYKNLHKAYWRFIYMNELPYKPLIYGRTGKLLQVTGGCWACEYDVAIMKEIGYRLPYAEARCTNCPLRDSDCSKFHEYCLNPNHAYWLWRKTENPKYALEIAELNWEDYKDG